MSETRQICTIKKIEASMGKITIEVDGKIMEAEQGVGANFQIGDHACLLTSMESNIGLVVALNAKESLEVKKKYESKAEEKTSINKLDPQNQVIPPDHQLEVEKFLDSKNIKDLIDLNREYINEPLVMDKVNKIFESVDEKEVEFCLRDIFPFVAIQTSKEHQDLKIKIFKKADVILSKKMVTDLTNREVHQYLSEKIDKISNKEEHDDFFRSLGFYLVRLKKIQMEKALSSKEMGAIFYPVYSHYIKKFKKEIIDDWIQVNSKNTLS